MNDPRPRLAILGGAGKFGSGMAFCWAHAGYSVVLGSRDAARAARVADELNAQLGSQLVSGTDNLQAARQGEVVVLSVPYAAQRAAADEVRSALEGKILVDVTVPLVTGAVTRVQLPPEGSVVAALQRHLGPGVRVVSAFQNVSAAQLRDVDTDFECDVIVCSDDEPAAGVVVGLAQAAGLRGFYGGPLANSVAAEALSSVLIKINRTFHAHTAGIRIIGIPE